MKAKKEEICDKACNHLQFLVKTEFFGSYTVKMKAGEIYHAEENKSLRFGGTERGDNDRNNK